MRIRFIVVLFVLISGKVFTQTPTITTLEPVQTSFCAGGNILVQFETTGTFNFGNIFTAQLSDMWGNFSNPITIGSIPINAGVIPATIPSNTTFGINYRVRVVSSNPYVVGTVSPMPPIVITSTAVSATIIAQPDDTICMGDTIELYTTPNESYVWSNGETTQTINVTQSGTFRVTVTNYFTGCEVTSEDISIVVHPLPDLQLGIDTGICDGDVLILDAGTAYVNYNWNSGSSSAHDYYVYDTGIYDVTVRDTNNCVNSDTIEVIVNPLPVVTLGNDTSFCGNVYYLDAGTGFDGYNWNNGLSLNQVLQISNAGIYFVEVTDTNHCKMSDSIDINIMNIPLVSLGNDLVVCGTSLTLDAGSDYETYNWNDSTGLNRFFTVTQTGLYYVLVIDSNDCKVSDTIHITLYYPPFVNLGNDTGGVPGTVFYFDAGTGHSTYYWNDGSTAQTMLVNTAQFPPGLYPYSVVVGDENNCFNTDTVFVMVDVNYNVAELSHSQTVLVYPNPFTGKAYIQLPQGFNSETVCEVYDINGKLCAFNASVAGQHLIISSQEQKAGLYQFYLKSPNNKHAAGRFVIVD